MRLPTHITRVRRLETCNHTTCFKKIVKILVDCADGLSYSIFENLEDLDLWEVYGEAITVEHA